MPKCNQMKFVESFDGRFWSKSFQPVGYPTGSARSVQAYASDSSSLNEVEFLDKTTDFLSCDLDLDSGNFAFPLPNTSDQAWSSSSFAAIKPSLQSEYAMNSFGTLGNKQSKKSSSRSASILLRSKALILSDSESDSEERDPPKATIDYSKSSQPNRKVRFKAKRKKTEKEGQAYLYSPVNNSQCSGKRKRSNTISAHHEELPTPTEISYTRPFDVTTSKKKSLGFDQNTRMDCDESGNISSTLSEESNMSDNERKFEADDEQSDFFEASLMNTNRSLINLNIQQKKSVKSRFSLGSGEGSSGCNSSSIFQRSSADCPYASTSKYNPPAMPKNPFASTSTHVMSTSSTGTSSAVWKKRRKNHENKFF